MRIECTVTCANGKKNKEIHIFPAIAFEINGEISDCFHLVREGDGLHKVLTSECPGLNCGQPLSIDQTAPIKKLC